MSFLLYKIPIFAWKIFLNVLRKFLDRIRKLFGCKQVHFNIACSWIDSLDLA